jgi:hypothetical protein
MNEGSELPTTLGACFIQIAELTRPVGEKSISPERHLHLGELLRRAAQLGRQEEAESGRDQYRVNPLKHKRVEDLFESDAQDFLRPWRTTDTTGN